MPTNSLMANPVPRPAGAEPARKIRVLVVDDSAVIRRLVAQVLEPDPSLEIVGTAQNGVVALQRIAQANPDILTLDVEMPEMDGLETLRRVRASHPHIRVIMFSTLTERGAATTIEALSLGASDYVTKVSHGPNLEKSIDALRGQLIPKIKQFFHPGPTGPAARPAPPPVLRTAAPQSRTVTPEAVVIGVSTGGPTALHEIIPQIPGNFPLPILIVQHMPPLFTKLLAERLATRSRVPVLEAVTGQPVEAGKVYIAPGDFHMRASGQPGRVKIVLDQGPQENSCRPSVDVLFRSAAEVWGGSAVGIVLTGMGQDGLAGCGNLRAKGSYLIAQDEASSVVWGMPGFVARAGLADRILPLKAIIPDVLDRCEGAIRSGLGSSNNRSQM
jgi:two-component system chemotaxis response regulator CheB